MHYFFCRCRSRNGCSYCNYTNHNYPDVSIPVFEELQRTVLILDFTEESETQEDPSTLEKLLIFKALIHDLKQNFHRCSKIYILQNIFLSK